MSTPPESFAINVAAEAFKVRREQIDDDLKHGRFPGAWQSERGPWMIPRAELEAAGYRIDPRWVKRRAGYLRNARRS